MNFDKYTVKSQEAIQQAAAIATNAGNQAIEPGHLLNGVMHADENVISFYSINLVSTGLSLRQNWMKL